MRRLCTLLVVLVAIAGSACSKEKPTPTATPGTPAAAADDAAAPAAGDSTAAVAAGTAAAADAAAAATPAPGGAAATGEARPLYYERAITAADLEGRTLRELALLRNTIFARIGHTFRKPWLRDYFTAQPWYKPAAKDDESRLAAYDRPNASTIATREGALTRADLEKSRVAILARPTRTPDDEIELSLLATRLGGGEEKAAGAAATEKRSPLEDPDQLDRLLALDELEILSRRDLRILRNTVYARRGRAFKSELLQEWFGNMDWYHADPSYTDERLTSIDQKNIRLIRSVEDSLGGPLSDHEHKSEDGWFAES